MRSFFKIQSLLIVVLTCIFQCHAQEPPSDCQTGDEDNASRICVKFKFTNGRLDFDQEASVFTPTDKFLQKLKIQPETAKQIIWSDLRKVFGLLQRPYRFALTAEEKKLDDKNQFSAETAEVRDLTESWEAFITKFDNWANRNNRITFDKIFGPDDATLPTSTTDPIGGIIFFLTISDRFNASIIFESYDPASNLITFKIADPIDNWDDTNQVQILLPNQTNENKRKSRVKRISQILRPLAGKPRCRDCIEKRLVEFYGRFEYVPNIQFDNRNTSPLIVTIDESPLIVRISWQSLKKENEKDLDKILYSLLTDESFRKYIDNRQQIITDKNFGFKKYTDENGIYLRTSQVQVQQLLVNQLGYSLSFAPEDGISKYNLVINKNDDEDNAPEKENLTPEAVPATATKEGLVTAHKQEKERETEFTPDLKKENENANKPRKDKKRYIGGGLEYIPQQGVRFFGLGQLNRFPFIPGSVDSISGKFGSSAQNPIGSFNYFSDYLFFNSLHRRISVNLTYSSDFESERKLDDTLMDERRDSGIARIEFEPFRNKSGNLLRFYAEGKRSNIKFRTPSDTIIKQKLTTIDLGALYFYEPIEMEYPFRIKIEPNLRIGLGLTANEERFQKWTVSGNIHKMLPGRFEADFRGRFENASLTTPVFELPSFGGVDVVRGFRKDEILGRRLWSLQNEIWIPLPVGNAESEGFKKLIRQSVKLSPFYDVGGIYDVSDAVPGIRSGLGLGLRLIYNPIVLKFDYGYGHKSENKKGKFYFSITSNLPF